MSRSVTIKTTGITDINLLKKALDHLGYRYEVGTNPTVPTYGASNAPVDIYVQGGQRKLHYGGATFKKAKDEYHVVLAEESNREFYPEVKEAYQRFKVIAQFDKRKNWKLDSEEVQPDGSRKLCFSCYLDA